MTWVLTGGAGYIGAHVSRALLAAGHRVVVLDDMSTGRPERIPDGVPLVRASVLDTALLLETFRAHRPEGVVHLAAKKSVPESVREPLLYYRENVEGCRTLLDCMQREGVPRIVFSSSAAVYGNPDVDLLTEDTPTEPTNPYGETKLVCERMLRDVARATGISSVALRYFNVAGADGPELADRGASNLVPMAFHAVEQGRAPQIFGADYPTPDGSCVRDFIHVADVASAHVAAVTAQLGTGVAATYNVGCGRGYSVREVLAAVQDVTGAAVAPVVAARRAGDPARVVADPTRIRTQLGWQARRDLQDMVSSAWLNRSH